MTESQRVHLHSKRACDRMSANSFPLSEKACNRNSSSTGEINFDPPSRHPKRHKKTPGVLEPQCVHSRALQQCSAPSAQALQSAPLEVSSPQCHDRPSAQGRPSTHTECAGQTKCSLSTQRRPSTHTECAGKIGKFWKNRPWYSRTFRSFFKDQRT